jgi:hypothetical protein
MLGVLAHDVRTSEALPRLRSIRRSLAEESLARSIVSGAQLIDRQDAFDVKVSIKRTDCVNDARITLTTDGEDCVARFSRFQKAYASNFVPARSGIFCYGTGADLLNVALNPSAGGKRAEK